MTLVWLAAGGAAGAISRYLVTGWVQDLGGDRFPWGTFAVNVSGSFALGLLFALAIDRARPASEARIRAVLPELDAMVEGGLITLERVEVMVDRSPEKEEPT